LTQNEKNTDDETKVLSYSDRKHKMFPPRYRGPNSKRTKKKVSKEIKANFDAFEINKKTFTESELLTKPLLRALAGGSPVYEKPVYIGQNVYIRPSYVVSLPEYAGGSKYNSLDFKANEANLQDKTHKGLLSSKAIGKMKNSINWLLCSADEKNVYHKKLNSWFKFKVNFITLTLPDTTMEITNTILQKRLLNPFLTYMRTYHNLQNYVWKLEFQKNGKLHVHFISDVFIHHSKIRSCWNGILAKNNFLIDFTKKFGHCDPNSTDIHSIKKIKNLGAYLAKYMTKNAADLVGIKGRIWGCNQELSKANQTKLFIDRDQCHLQLKPLMNSDIEYKPIEILNPKTGIFKKIGELFFLKYSDWENTMFGEIKKTFNETILFLKNVSASETQLLEV